MSKTPSPAAGTNRGATWIKRLKLTVAGAAFAAAAIVGGVGIVDTTPDSGAEATSEVAASKKDRTSVNVSIGSGSVGVQAYGATWS